MRQSCSSPILQAPETVSGVHSEGELTGNDLVLERFSGTSSIAMLFRRQPCSVALAARQPIGTRSAQIRWSIAPNRHRIRWLSASRSQ